MAIHSFIHSLDFYYETTVISLCWLTFTVVLVCHGTKMRIKMFKTPPPSSQSQPLPSPGSWLPPPSPCSWPPPSSSSSSPPPSGCSCSGVSGSMEQNYVCSFLFVQKITMYFSLCLTFWMLTGFSGNKPCVIGIS